MEYLHHHVIFILVLTMLSFRAISQQYQVMQYVLQWPPSFCQTKKCKTGLSQEFSIHGLWPAYGSGQNVQCISLADQRQKVRDEMNNNRKLENLLHTIWPNLEADDHDDYWFWTNEWVNHGCCILNITQYFRAAERVHQKFFVSNGKSTNLINYLVQGGIQPSNHAPYLESNIRAALSKLVGANVNVYLSCYVNYNTGQVILEEVHLCFDTGLTNFITCPLLRSRDCANDIYLPSF